MKDGLTLLLLFAFGPLKRKVCGNDFFIKSVQKYLEGDYLQGQKIERKLPRQLKTAWPKLLEISKKNKTTPLSFKNVSIYVFKSHNRFVLPECRVQSGIIEKILDKKNILLIKKRKERIKVRFLKPLKEKLKPGDKIFFHHGWLIGTNALSR